MSRSIKKTAIWNYAILLRNKGERPAAVIQAKALRTWKFGKSGKVAFPLAGKLENKLLSLGEIGTKRFTSSIGYCAEVAASNRLLLQPAFKNFQTKDIIFSPALRPRTMQVVPRCQNCIDTFN